MTPVVSTMNKIAMNVLERVSFGWYMNSLVWIYVPRDGIAGL